MQSCIEQFEHFDVICLFGFTASDILPLEGKQYIFFQKIESFSLLEEIYCDGVTCDLPRFEELCRKNVFRSFFYAVHPSLEGDSLAQIQFWVDKCKELQWQCHLSASDYQDFGIKVFDNIVKGMRNGLDSDSFAHMKGSLKGVPAIICGAGPSLEKEVELLDGLTERGVIFAGGAALGLLTHLGVPIHIAAGIDPDPSYERARMHGSFESPFFYQSRFSHSILETIQGPLIQVPSNPGYQLENWLQGGVFFDGGWTVSTFCSSLAVYFGCSPIIFVGMDLSYREGSSSYSKGVLVDDPLEAIEWNDPVVGPLITKKDWILAARWIEELVRASPGSIFYNASSGISLEGVPKVALSEILEKNLTEFYDIDSLVHQLFSNVKQMGKEEENLLLLEESLERCLSFVEILMALFAKYYPESPVEKGFFLINLLDLQEEIAYQKIVDPIWSIWRFPMERKFLDSYARDVNQFLFFKKVILEYRTCLCKLRPMK